MSNVWAMAQELIDAGDLIERGDGRYEDMGGHIISDRDVPSYFHEYVKRLSAEERAEVFARTGAA